MSIWISGTQEIIQYFTRRHIEPSLSPLWTRSGTGRLAFYLELCPKMKTERGRAYPGEGTTWTVGRGLLAGVLLSGAFLFTWGPQVSLSFVINYWALLYHMDKQVLNDVSFMLTSKRLFYCCILYTETLQWFSNLWISASFPPPPTPNTSYISTACRFKNLNLTMYLRNWKQVFKQMPVQTNTCLNMSVKTCLHCYLFEYQKPKDGHNQKGHQLINGESNWPILTMGHYSAWKDMKDWGVLSHGCTVKILC